MCARLCTSLCEIESCRHFFPKCWPYLDRLDCFGVTARIFMFKVEKSCANGDSVTLEFMLISVKAELFNFR